MARSSRTFGGKYGRLIEIEMLLLVSIDKYEYRVDAHASNVNQDSAGPITMYTIDRLLVDISPLLTHPSR